MLSCGGLVRVWVLLAIVALPYVNHTRSYEKVGKSLASKLPTQTTCVRAYKLPNEARAAMYYYANVPFIPNQSAFTHVQCPYILTTNQALNLPKIPDANIKITFMERTWRVAWSGERVSERKKSLILLRID